MADPKKRKIERGKHTMDNTTSDRKNPGPRLIEGMKDLVKTLENGTPLHERYTMKTVQLHLEPRDYGPQEVQVLRHKLRASQGVFAKLLGVSIKSVQAWEQGNNPPTPMARRLLDTIDENPEPWERKLREAAAQVL